MNNLIRPTLNVISKTKIYNPSKLHSQYKFASSRTVATRNHPREEDVENDGPIRYTHSPAYKYTAKSSRTGETVPRLWYEPYVILGSLTIFMVYFCMLREENQIDRELERTLYSRISGLEEHQLHASLEHNRSLGLSTADIEARLRELNKT